MAIFVLCMSGGEFFLLFHQFWMLFQSSGGENCYQIIWRNKDKLSVGKHASQNRNWGFRLLTELTTRQSWGRKKPARCWHLRTEKSRASLERNAPLTAQKRVTNGTDLKRKWLRPPWSRLVPHSPGLIVCSHYYSGILSLLFWNME